METPKKSTRGKAVVLTLSGKIQMGDTEELEQSFEKLLRSRENHIILDLSRVSYVCSSALGVLIATRRKIARQNGEIRLIISAGEVLDLFRLTMVDRVFPIHASVDEAEKAFAG